MITDVTLSPADPVSLTEIDPTEIRPDAGESVSHTPHDDVQVGSHTGQRNAGPPQEPKGDRIPGGWQTISRSVIIPGRGWVYTHSALDAEGNMDPDWAEEVLFQRADFFRGCYAGATIIGNTQMSERIHERLARRRNEKRP